VFAARLVLAEAIDQNEPVIAVYGTRRRDGGRSRGMQVPQSALPRGRTYVGDAWERQNTPKFVTAANGAPTLHTHTEDPSMATFAWA
jgi:hypothetical protein